MLREKSPTVKSIGFGVPEIIEKEQHLECLRPVVGDPDTFFVLPEDMFRLIFPFLGR